jgi:hypothetical protein
MAWIPQAMSPSRPPALDTAAAAGRKLRTLALRRSPAQEDFA